MRKPRHEETISDLQTSQPTLETFQDLLHRHPDAFYLARTAKALQAHWQLMKQYYLLEDQTGKDGPGAAAGAVRRQVWHMSKCGGAAACRCPVHLRLPNSSDKTCFLVEWQGLWHQGKGNQLAWDPQSRVR